MIKHVIMMLVMLAMLIGVQTVIPAEPPAFAPSPPSFHDQWSLLFKGMSAIGTVLVALMAIFGQRIRN